jgi:hypothetical protein
MSRPDAVAVDLTPDERSLLSQGLNEWGGPATPTDALARVMGFAGTEDLLSGEGRSLQEALAHGEPLAGAQWRKALLATEIVFASDLVGSGVDWASATGLTDEETIKLLRMVQRKVASAIYR